MICSQRCRVLPPHTYKHISPPPTVFSVVSRYDPTRTTVLRRIFVADMRRRFKKIPRLITKSIVDQDYFGLNSTTEDLKSFGVTLAKDFAFSSSEEKADNFMSWLRTEEKKHLLQTVEVEQMGTSTRAAWTNRYVYSGYEKGVSRARQELRNGGYMVPSAMESGGLAMVMNQPVHADRVGILFSRVYRDLKGITDNMDSQISRVLAQGLIEGKNPVRLAKTLNSVILGGGASLGVTDTLGRFIPAMRRAETLARTEIIRAHHLGGIQEYRNWGLEGVEVQAEWVTAGYHVCPDCEALEGKIFTLDEIESMIPLHPNCRCCAIPVKKSMSEKKKKSTAAPTVSKPVTLADKLRKESLALQGNSFETAVAFDKNGVELLRKEGSKSAVHFSDADVDALRKADGAVLTHNHPRGTSFSYDDINFMCMSELSEIRAFGTEYEYVARLTKDIHPAAIKPMYDEAFHQVKVRFDRLIDGGNLTMAEANAEHHHEIWKLVQKNTNWLHYERITK